ncbi:MAG: phosphatidylserine decarboxylase family protein [Calditrichia bacterium]|jgi:phosphatidylserine decarboxylase|nr:phosphatidylserine decarboxylase family protein [Calditrichia bacterium]
MIAPDGIKVIVITLLIFVLCIIVTYFFPVLLLKILTGIVAIIFLFNFYFFRDPERNIPKGNDLILSPADGTVVMIEDVDEPYYFKTKVRRVSIFLSVFDVHVNRIPVIGKVEFLKYIKGKFLVAFADKASEENEQSIIGIRHEKGKILFKQIAGIIARRIIYHVVEGDTVDAGDRFGLIRYGSRVDMFFPENVELKVSLKDKVYGGETIIGEFK